VEHARWREDTFVVVMSKTPYLAERDNFWRHSDLGSCVDLLFLLLKIAKQCETSKPQWISVIKLEVGGATALR
jgi:hypothetical protein